MRILGLCIVIVFFVSFSPSVFASTISGGSYTLNGGPTAISTARSLGGTYSEQSTADSAGGNTSAGVYATTPTPAPPASLQNASSGGGVSGQIVIEELPSTNSSQSTTKAGSQTTSETISLTNVSLVRGTPTSITVHFSTSAAAIGSVRYSPSSGETTTLTDSAPTIDHTFTISNLSPSLTYQLQLAAVISGASTNVYQLTVSPEYIGTVGSSVTPALVPYTPHSIPSVALASSTKNTAVASPRSLFTYILMLFVLIGTIIILILWLRRSHSH